MAEALGQVAEEACAYEMVPILMRIGGAYYHRPGPGMTARELIRGEWRAKPRPEALIFAGPLAA